MTFQQKTLDLFDQVNAILAQYDGPVTLRQVFYRLVALQVLENDKRAYTLLSKHLTNARRAGLVDADRIVDHIRNTIRVPTWEDLEDFLQAVRVSYRREKWTSQPYCIEVWCEKDAIAGVLQPITDEYEVTLYPCRGYNSYSALKEAAGRLAERAGGNVILYLGDFDPSGQDMPRDIRDRLRGDFGVDPYLRVIALTLEQIAEHDLPPAMAKRTDTRAAKFIERHGDIAVELDALPPDVLQAVVREHLDQFFDKATFEEEAATEAGEREHLQALIGEV